MSVDVGDGAHADGVRVRARALPLIELPVIAPYRLDLTVAALRRLSTNRVDRFEEGTYSRAFSLPEGLAIALVRQRDATTLDLEVAGPRGARVRVAALVRHMLGIDREPPPFVARAAAIPWLHEVAVRMQGMRAPRYPSVWEAAVNAVVFQQVSIHAAAAILGRTIEALGGRVERDGHAVFAFPPPEGLARASDDELRAAGLGVAKVATLRRVARALLDGMLEDRALEQRTSFEAAAELVKIKGIGPWTATVILLRGLGRLDVFPLNDSGVARAVRELGGEEAAASLGETLERLGDLRGLLYYHLLLARLEARGQL